MPDNRRTSRGLPDRGRPGTRTGPGRGSPSGRNAARPAGGAGAAGGGRSRRPRLTGRAAILVLVVAVLTISYASSMRAYLEQRAHITDLKSQIVLREANIDDLEREKRRWEDPAYVRAQARERFGYLLPGETSYVVLDENGKPLRSEASLRDPSEVIVEVPTAWWSDAWDSVELAGNPPRQPPPALTEIDGSEPARSPDQQ